MVPIFPGMDPYLEAPTLWPDVHTSLSFAIRDQIQPALGPRYIAAITPYIAMETIEIVPVRRVVPDVGIFDREASGNTRGGGTAIAPAPLTGTVALEFPTRYHRIEIRPVGEETLVTAIEILSPVNKRPGAEAADAYDRKRREIFNSDAHLIEIDLLRGGRRPALLEPLPDAPYFIFLSRATRRPVIEIWPLPLQTPIPIVPIPLQWPDPDIPLNLNEAIAHAYRSARYDLRIDYRQSPPAPELPAEDAAWLDDLLRARGLRPA
jgi:hypothetical protein